MKEPFTEIIKSESLKDISIDLIEKMLDDKINNEVLKEVPILKSLLAAKSIYNSYKDRIFIKKAMKVLLELGKVNWKERVELASELNDEHGEGIEKILMAIDKLETYEKCRVYGRLCRIKALGKIDLNKFLRLTKLIQDAYLEDLALITDFKKGEKKEIYEGDYYSILSLGLIYQEPSEQMPITRNKIYNEYDPEFKGGEIKFNYLLSDLGEILLEYYNELFSKDEE